MTIETPSVDALATDTLATEIAELLDETEIVSSEEDDNSSSEDTIVVNNEETSLSEDGTPLGESADTESIVTLPDNTPPVNLSEPTEVATLKAQVAQLTELVGKLSAPKEESSKKPEFSLNLDDLIASTDFDEIMESREKFMGFIKEALQIVGQTTTGYVQEIVPQSFTQQMSLHELRESFYKDNPELNAVRPYVASVASNVAAQHPEWGVAEVLVESAKVARESLGISKLVNQGDTQVPSTPSPVLPGSKGVRSVTPKVSKLQQEINELLED